MSLANFKPKRTARGFLAAARLFCNKGNLLTYLYTTSLWSITINQSTDSDVGLLKQPHQWQICVDQSHYRQWCHPKVEEQRFAPLPWNVGRHSLFLPCPYVHRNEVWRWHFSCILNVANITDSRRLYRTCLATFTKYVQHTGWAKLSDTTLHFCL